MVLSQDGGWGGKDVYPGEFEIVRFFFLTVNFPTLRLPKGSKFGLGTTDIAGSTNSSTNNTLM